jgi:alcohol dehydrogenase
MNPPPPLLYAPGALAQVGELARRLGFRRTLIVADHGMEQAGHIAALVATLSTAGVECTPWSGFSANPDSAMIEHGRAFAAQLGIDSLIGLGGGSSLDAAKGVNFVLTNGGTMKDYWGYGKATQPLLPMLGIPATTGTGSEAQSYALISDPATHVKMACGDPMASFRYAVLDPLLTLSQPPAVRAAAGYDAISHAVESYVTTKRTQSSQLFSRQAWDLLHASYAAPATLTSNANLQLGAWFAGCAIEASMLGAAHACANPLTARYGITHGVAIAILLPHVVRWNACPEYADLHPDLAGYLAELATGLALPLRECGVTMEMLPQLAHDAAQQWTGRHNPRPFDAAAALELYQCAY